MQPGKLELSKRYLSLEAIIGNRDKAVKGFYPCSKLTWFKGVALGRFLRPIVFSPTNYVWDADEIDALVQRETQSPGTLVWLFQNQKEQA